jgi:hypothetical protein
MILTKEFLQQTNACTDGYRFALSAGLVGGDYDAAILYCRSNGEVDYGDWLEKQKITEAYVRANGTEITMLEKFKVFDPYTGQYTEYASETEAKAALLLVAQKVIDEHQFSLIRAISNEKGDEAWTPIPVNSFTIVEEM